MDKIVSQTESRRMEIVKTARFLFQAKGYDQTPIQDVMDSLGISKGGIYHYFKSKQELLEAVIEDIVNEGVERMQKIINESTGSALDKIGHFFPSKDMFGNNDEILSQLQRPGNIGMYARIILMTLHKQSPVFAQLIEQGCKEGIFHTDTPLETTEFIITGIQFLIDQGIYSWPEETIIRRIEAFPGIIERLLQAPSGSFGFLSILMPKHKENNDY